MPTTITRLPIQVNLVLYEGDDFTFMVTVRDSAGLPVDLTGVTARAQIRTSVSAESILGEFTPTIDALAGNIWLHLDDSVSSILPPTGVWDVEIDRSGDVETLAAGTISMTADVTR